MDRTYGLYLADLQRARTDSLGIINYSVGLARALPSYLRADEALVVYVSAGLAEEVQTAAADDRVTYRMTAPIRHPVHRLWTDHVTAVRRAGTDRLSVLHFPKGFIPASASHMATAVVATLHDDMPLRYANRRVPRGLAAKVKRAYFSWAAMHSLRLADAVITVSDSSRQALSRAADGQQWPAAQPTVTGQGVALPTRPFVPLSERQPQLLHLGSPLEHKRSADAIRFATDFVADQAPGLKLVVTGRLDDDTEKLAVERGVIRIPELLSNTDLAGLMVSSRALIFSSEYEGFGLPPVESLALGTPVTYCAAPAMNQVLHDVPGSHAVGEQRSFNGALRRVLELDEGSLRGLQQTMADRWSWEAVAERTLDVYRRVGAAGRRRERMIS